MTSENRVAVITGAASGIGRALAVHYAHRGVHSVIGTFPGDPHDPEETLRLVKDAGGQGVIHEVDVRSTPSVDAFAERAVQEYGRLDYAVANAGILRNSPLAEMTDRALARHARRRPHRRDADPARRVREDDRRRSDGCRVLHCRRRLRLGGTCPLRSRQGRRPRPDPQCGRRVGAARHPRQRRDPRTDRNSRSPWIR